MRCKIGEEGNLLTIPMKIKDSRPKRKHVLVIGPPGSGKSFLSGELKRFGFNAVDADRMVGLSRWIDEEGNEATYHEGLGGQWLRTHRFMWDKAVLEDYLSKNKDLYLFGVSDNIYEMIDLFDRVFYLDLDFGELERRLMHANRQNPMGRITDEREVVLEEARKLKKKAKALGIESIDSTLPLEEIMRRICTKV